MIANAVWTTRCAVIFGFLETASQSPIPGTTRTPVDGHRETVIVYQTI